MALAYYNEIEPEMLAYLITNTTNGRRYIGITVGRLQRRWAEHQRLARNGSPAAIHAAIRCYGVAAFTVTELAHALRRADLGALEAQLISQLGTKAPHGYNLTDGGEGVRGLDPSRVKQIADKNRGRKHSEASRKAIGEARRGHEVTQETREAIGAARRGKPLSDEHRAKLAQSKQGKKMPPRSDEHRQRIALGLKRAHARRKGLEA
jgi:group I intron endonuclease